MLEPGQASASTAVIPPDATVSRSAAPRPAAGVPRPSATVNLGEQSLFYGIKGRRYFGSRFGNAETSRNHHDEVQRYQIDRAILESDEVVNVATLRTHRMSGIASSLHNAVGISANGDWLPHHTIGTPKVGGDSYADNSIRSRLRSALLSVRRPPFARRAVPYGITKNEPPGSWWGNDTLWRTILDLNRVLLYARADGTLAEQQQRQTFAVVSVGTGGQADRPELSNSASELIVAGPSFTAVDLVCAKLMGFDWRRIPHVAHVFDDHDLPLVDFTYEEIAVRSEIGAFDRRLVDIDRQDCRAFPSPVGWAGWLEARDGSI